jgi:hypothetical protein
MNDTIEQVIPVRTARKPASKPVSFLDMLGVKKQIDKHKFSRVWAERNIDNGDIIVDTLEIEPIIIDQYLFVEESKDLLNKLKRMGFVEVTEYPKQDMFKFCYALHNKKYNVALSVYPPKMKTVMKLAEEITKDTQFGREDNLTVFLSSVKVLNK